MHLIVTEKNIAARRIAAILAPKSPKKERVSGVDVYRYELGKGKSRQETAVVGLSGHIVGIDFPKEYNNWQKVDSRTLIDAEITTTPINRKIVTALRALGKEADRVTIATDYDREGELIGVEALNIIKKVNPEVPFDRVRYSAITPKAIDAAFTNPTSVDFNLADAGHSRQVIDLVWGAALTRYISLAAGRLGKMFLSVGRVQSPTLSLIVDREKERNIFVPTPYWEIHVELETKSSETFSAQHSTRRFLDKKEASEVFNKLGKKAELKEMEKGTKSDQPPTPFNTTGFISAANSIGLSPANAMRIAESLYTNGYISYPRTDNTVYPETLDLRAQIEIFKEGPFKEYAEALLEKKELIPTRGKKETTDHPPIYPASLAKESELKEDEWKVYELVARRFFATFAGPSTWETMRLRLEINAEEFRSNGARMLESGWRWYYPYNAPEDRLFPELSEGEILKVIKKEMLDKETQPPGRYGQGRLINIMEELGLGTKATRHEIISKLYSRAYIHGNPVQPTNTSFAVVETLERYSPTITKPDMTKLLEENMDLIAEGKIKEESVLEESREMLQQVFSELDKNRDKIIESLQAGLREDKIIGKCPLCGNELMIRRSKRGSRFIGCSNYPNCTFSLPLPKSGQIVVTDKQCETHGLHHIRIINAGKRPWDLGCPQCNFIEWQKTQKEEQAQQPKKEKPKTITDIEGVGKATAGKLEGAGITSVEALAEADPIELAKTIKTSVKKVKTWQISCNGGIVEDL
ncbi:DNA topoisomerase I [Methanosarcina siciliae HI350]|uniref:DNA topoisomerase 1 n=1 Tax=Methanosarcina siciliae HI350 TaxID=1434119 RepID=A0A0E3PD38_9EURY|nr:DNA topoisomerase I [Methanosarcina siciliae]AKB31979.1 DNA topoisomerase I [Methanosarcina siciliae HI350]